jgi:hypothetical protein
MLFRTWNVSTLESWTYIHFQAKHIHFSHPLYCHPVLQVLYWLLCKTRFFSDIWCLNIWGCLKFVYKVLNQTAPNQIAMQQTMRRQTKACITKSSCEICGLVRYCSAQNGNLLPTCQDNLLAPSSKVKKSKRKNRALLKLTNIIFFRDFVHRQIFSRHMTFQKLVLSLFSGKDVPNLKDTLGWIIVSHWAPQRQ